jgi:hypothetical protein
MKRLNLKNNSTKDFRKAKMANQNLIIEFWEFLRVRKRFWLLPIILVLVLLSAIIVFTESSVIAPFIYALF